MTEVSIWDLSIPLSRSISKGSGGSFTVTVSDRRKRSSKICASKSVTKIKHNKTVVLMKKPHLNMGVDSPPEMGKKQFRQWT